MAQSELTMIYEAAERGFWSNPNPSRCGCRGGGWFLSDVDSWHECPYHGGTPYPEDDYHEEAWDHAAHERAIYVTAWRHFRDEGVALGMNADLFTACCRRELGTGEHTPAEWVDAADALVSELTHTLADANAQAEGYVCDLERRWDLDGQAEAMGWGID